MTAYDDWKTTNPNEVPAHIEDSLDDCIEESIDNWLSNNGIELNKLFDDLTAQLKRDIEEHGIEPDTDMLMENPTYAAFYKLAWG